MLIIKINLWSKGVNMKILEKSVKESKETKNEISNRPRRTIKRAINESKVNFNRTPRESFSRVSRENREGNSELRNRRMFAGNSARRFEALDDERIPKRRIRKIRHI